MGATYANIILKSDRAAVLALVAETKLSAFLSKSERDVIALFPKISADSKMDEHLRLCAMLSLTLQCELMCNRVHDDSIFEYLLFDRGRKVDSYCSAPDYFGDGTAKPEGGDPDLIIKMFGSEAVSSSSVREILSYCKSEMYERVEEGQMEEEEVKYVFESERHRDLNRCLALPNFATTIVIPH